MKLALKALKAHLATLPEAPPLINGLAPFQRFFLAWSQNWRENGELDRILSSFSCIINSLIISIRNELVKKERAMQLVTLDPHGPNELRCNGTVANIAEFYEVIATPSVRLIPLF